MATATAAPASRPAQMLSMGSCTPKKTYMTNVTTAPRGAQRNPMPTKAVPNAVRSCDTSAAHPGELLDVDLRLQRHVGREAHAAIAVVAPGLPPRVGEADDRPRRVGLVPRLERRPVDLVTAGNAGIGPGGTGVHEAVGVRIEPG